MKFYIDYSKLNESPFDLENNNFIFENEDNIYQIKNELLYGNSTCFLVSGYRGAGKTSFIRRIEKDVIEKNSDIIFINLNFAKYENFGLLIRKVIREVYLSIIKNSKILKNVRSNSNEVIQSLELLYERTFFEVLGTQKIAINKETEKSSIIEINVKKLLFIISFQLLIGLDLKFNISSWLIKNSNILLKYIDVIVLLIITIYGCIETMKWKNASTKKKSDIEEINRKTLYDDEISEYQLRSVLSDLKKSGVRLIFVIDELDKIDDESQIDNLISELKPVILSGLANFILVSGQKLYYKLQTTHMVDDAVISSVFSKLIHVPLLSINSFHQLFRNLVIDYNNESSETLNEYIDSLILKSNRIPRKFLNLIRQELVWEDKNAYLEIFEKNEKVIKTDSRILRIISKIEESEIVVGGYSDGIRDFFIMQLHLWIQRMQQKGFTYFTKDEIYNPEKDYKTTYPFWYLSQLNDLVLLLLDKMVEESLLEKKEDLIQDESFVSYKWSNDVDLKTDSIYENQGITKSKFLEYFIGMEKFVRDIYEDLIDSNNEIDRAPSIRQMLTNLVNMSILNDRWINNNRINKLTNLRNKIVHGKDISLEDLDLSEQYRFEFARLKSELIESYSFTKIQRIMSKYNYELYKGSNAFENRDIGFDFIAHIESETKPIILFDIKYIVSNTASRRQYIIKAMNNYKTFASKTTQETYLAILWFETEERKPYSSIVREFDSVISNKTYSKYANNIFIYHISELKTNNVSSLDLYLEQFIKILKNRNNEI